MFAAAQMLIGIGTLGMITGIISIYSRFYPDGARQFPAANGGEETQGSCR